MKNLCLAVFCVGFVVVMFSSCADTPIEGGGIGAEFFVDENKPVDAGVENTNSYENADKLSAEDASKLFHTLAQLAPVSGFSGWYGAGSSGYTGGGGGIYFGGGGGYAGGYSGGPSGASYKAAGGGSVNPPEHLKVEDKTTEEIWQKFKVQVFIFDNKTYLVRDKLFVHVYKFAIQKYCIVDFNKNNVPELVFYASFDNRGSSMVAPNGTINIHTEDSEIRNIDLIPEITRIINITNVEAIDNETVKITGEKQYILTCDLDRDNPTYVFMEMAEEKE